MVPLITSYDHRSHHHRARSRDQDLRTRTRIHAEVAQRDHPPVGIRARQDRPLVCERKPRQEPKCHRVIAAEEGADGQIGVREAPPRARQRHMITFPPVRPARNTPFRNALHQGSNVRICRRSRSFPVPRGGRWTLSVTDGLNRGCKETSSRCCPPVGRSWATSWMLTLRRRKRRLRQAAVVALRVGCQKSVRACGLRRWASR